MITYKGIHLQLRHTLGPAKNLVCRDCGDGAMQWAYDHSDPAEIHEDGRVFSADLKRYRPLCVACHREFDSQRRAPGKRVLIEDRLGEPVPVIVASLRPMAWRRIARYIAGRTGIDVTGEAIRGWCS